MRGSPEEEGGVTQREAEPPLPLQPASLPFEMEGGFGIYPKDSEVTHQTDTSVYFRAVQYS